MPDLKSASVQLRPFRKGSLDGGALNAVLLLSLLLPFIAGGCGSQVDGETARKFADAQQVFDAAREPRDFLRAAGIYQEIRDAGVVSGAVLYNQGNAYLRAGRRGRAIACYRQALRYRPRDPRLAANLRRALGDDSRSAAPGGFDRFLLTGRWFSRREKVAMTSLLLLLAVALAAVATSVPRRSQRWWWACAIVVAFWLLGLLAVTLDWYWHDYRTAGVVTAESVVARRGNGEAYPPARDHPWEEGAEFTVRERRGFWVLAHFRSGDRGWLHVRDVVLY